ncbi:MAG: carbon starvation protein A [Myxococcales bacterium]|nr:carbon starvation protein A [Myxococcales bacterium]|tara:strand:- start:1046 stop:2722 length:1677 start_codon:yes stop_codon:yes gene_type:complete
MSVVVVLGALALFYFFGYRKWSVYLAEKVFGLSADERTPAHDPNLRDDVDYMPVDKHVLWGHHYTSIAGAAPIIGPAVAVIWGWVPALIWIVFGTIFMGAVHDFGALVLGARHQGRTMGDIAGEVIHPRVRLLLQVVIYFLIWVVLAVFAFAIGVLFTKYPATVIPVNFEIFVAIGIGYLFYKKGVPILWPSIIALVLLYVMVAVGVNFPLRLDAVLPGDAMINWAILLLIYAAVASVMPIWLLLQPRDFINSHQLIVGLSLLILGLLVLHPEIQAPAFNLNPEGAPPILPLLFVTIACGSISGFHGLVGSGTTSKQLNNMADARAIGYGGMLGEGTLAVIATVAVAAGLSDWGSHYHSWNSSGINAIANFVAGAGTFLEALYLPKGWAQAVVAVLAISFAATSMDTAARIQRLVVAELGTQLGWNFLTNRYVATAVAVGPAIPLVLAGPKVWGPLWMLFGTTNQLIAAMSLLVLFVYLYRAQKPTMVIAVPMLFLVAMTLVAMGMNLMTWLSSYGTENATAGMLTITLGTVIFVCEIWMVVEAVLILQKLKADRAAS